MLGQAFPELKKSEFDSSSSILYPADLTVRSDVPQWFAAYIHTRHEKSIARQLEERCIERFLPLYETTHRWRNGRHKVQLPLFPGYIFVRIPACERLKVLQVPGVGYIVGTLGVPTPLPLQDIERLRNALRSGVVAQPFPYLTAGTRVEIRSGPMQGLVGILRRRCGQFRVVISVDLIMQSIAVEVDACDVAPIRPLSSHRA